jgi:hypothetical protein
MNKKYEFIIDSTKQIFLIEPSLRQRTGDSFVWQVPYALHQGHQG